MFTRALKAAANRAFKSPEQRARDAAEALGLVVEPGNPFFQMDQAFLDEGMARMQSGGFKALEDLYMRKFSTKRRHISGRRAYALLDDVADRIVDSEMSSAKAERIVEDYRDVWRDSGRGPFASAVLAQMLYNTGYTYRGTGWANSVSAESWAMLAHYCEQAHDVLLESSKGAKDCPYWHRVLFSIGLSDGATPDELAQRFERARAFDPTDIDIYWTRAHQLMPRWHGSYDEIEEFATQSIASTKHDLGFSIYPRIYASLRDDEDVADTNADWSVMKRGFEDWVVRVPSQQVYNLYANMASAFDDKRTLRSLFAGRITEYHLTGWQSPQQAATVMESMRT